MHDVLSAVTRKCSRLPHKLINTNQYIIFVFSADEVKKSNNPRNASYRAAKNIVETAGNGS